MNCNECREYFAERWEEGDASDPGSDTSEHIRICADCREAYAEFEGAQTMLRGVEPVVPPAGLKNRVLATLAAEASVTAQVAARKSRRRAIAGLLAAAAALLMIGWFIGYGLGQQRAGLEVADGLRTSQEQLAGLRATVAARALEHREQMNALRAKLEHSTQDSDNRVESLLAQHQGDIAATVQAEEQAAADASRAEECAGHLQDVQARVVLLEAEIDRLRSEGRKISERGRQTTPRQIGSTSGSAALVGRHRATNEYDPRREETAKVVFFQRGGRYEAVVRGKRRDVVPKLLALARDRDDREISALALGTLENLLGSELAEAERVAVEARKRAEPERQSGFLGLWRDSFGMGKNSERAKDTTRPSQYERRLRDVKIAWGTASELGGPPPGTQR
jgi:hypothetical protein